jgi:hypothetical protein
MIAAYTPNQKEIYYKQQKNQTVGKHRRLLVSMQCVLAAQ